MHQYKTVAQILLILSIFNPVLTAPVVRGMHDTRDDVGVPVVVRNVEIISSSTSDRLIPSRSSPRATDGPTPSEPSPPPPPQLQDGSTALYGSPPSDGEVSFHEWPTPQGGPAPLAISSPPGEIVPAMDHPVPAPSEIVPMSPDVTEALPDAPATGHPEPAPSESATVTEYQSYTAGATTARMRYRMEFQRIVVEHHIAFIKSFYASAALFGIAAGATLLYRHYTHHHRAIDSDCVMGKGSRHA